MDVCGLGGVGHVGLGWGLAVVGWSLFIFVLLFADVARSKNILPSGSCLHGEVVVNLLSMLN